MRYKYYSIFILLIVLIFPVKSNGQAALLVLLFGDKVASENFYFSMKIGSNFTNMTNTEESKMTYGLNFGLQGNIKLSKQFYLVPEFAPLSRKGARNILVQPTGNVDFDNILSGTKFSEIQLNYIDIPVILKYYPHQKVHFGIGPYVSFLTSSEVYYEANVSSAGDVRIYQNIKDDFNNLDYGIIIEGAYAPWREVSADDLNFHIRFAYGLQDIFKESKWSSVHNYNLQFYVSIPFMKVSEN